MVEYPFHFHNEDVLISKLKEITLRKSTIKPYREAFITLETMVPEPLSPTQRYVLVSELRKIENIRGHYKDNYGLDIFSLMGYVEAEECDILPPIIEEHFINGRHHMLVADGQHRCFLALQYQMPITVVFVRNVSCPYYAYVLQGGWRDVEIINKLDEHYIKKFHISLDYKKLFRDYNSCFHNVSDSRPVVEGATVVDYTFDPGAVWEAPTTNVVNKYLIKK